MGQAVALGLTIGVEVPVVLALVALARWLPRDQLLRLAVIVAAASLCTHPFAWWANVDWLNAWPFENRAFLIEGAVIAAESLILGLASELSAPRAVACAAAANLASFGVGLALS